MKKTKPIQITAPAKINLALDVIARRADDYHQVDMVMQSIALADQITLEPASKLELTCNHPDLPVDERNLAWRAVQLLQEITGVSQGVKIHIDKQIPVAAGLGGGSTDAAAVLIGLNRLWGLGLSNARLAETGARLGADVPFCIIQGVARARGIGEHLTRIKSRLDCRLLLVTPNIQVSTALIYQKLRVDQIREHPRIANVIEALEKGDYAALYKAWGNVLEEVVLADYPIISQVKSYFHHFGLNHCLMSGSGPSVFALDPPEKTIKPFLAGLPSGWFGCLTNIQN